MSDTIVTHIYKIFSLFPTTLHFIKLYLIREKEAHRVCSVHCIYREDQLCVLCRCEASVGGTRGRSLGGCSTRGRRGMANVNVRGRSRTTWGKRGRDRGGQGGQSRDHGVGLEKCKKAPL